MTATQEREDLALLSALRTLFASGIYADLILVASSPSRPNQEQLFPVHKFILRALTPRFLLHIFYLNNSNANTATTNKSIGQLNQDIYPPNEEIQQINNDLTTSIEQLDKLTISKNNNNDATSTSTSTSRYSFAKNNSISTSSEKLNISDNNILRVHLYDIGAESLSLFLEYVYTSGHLHANDYTMAEWNAYMDYRKKFPIDEPNKTSETQLVSHIQQQSRQTSQQQGLSMAQRRHELLRCVNLPRMSDICFLLDDGELVYANKAILSVRCEVFRAMFDVEVGLTESRQDIVALPQVSKGSLLDLLFYIYAASLEIDPESSVDLMLLADRFALPALKQQAEVVITEAVLAENVCDIYMVASRVRASELAEKCLKFIANRDNLPAVAASEGFAFLDTDLIMKVAEEITKAFDRTYRPTQFVAEILCTIHILGREPLAVKQLTSLVSEMCTKLGTSRRDDELYTSRVRSDLVKDKFLHYQLKFDEVAHSPLYPTVATKNRDKRFLHYFPDPSDTITKQLASLLNVNVGLVMKCLVFWWYLPHKKTDKHYIVVLTCGSERIDTSMLQLHASVPLDAIVSLASSELIYRNLGASALWKLIPPLGFRRKIPTVIEERVLKLPLIYVPSGKHEVTWRMNPNELVTMFANLDIPCSIAPLITNPSQSTFVTKFPGVKEEHEDIPSAEKSEAPT